MAKPIIMPQVGQDIDTAIISEWRIKENDRVKKGDIIAIVDSDKASFEVEAFESGTVLKILYEEGDEAKVFEPIAYIGEPGERLKEAKIDDKRTVETDNSQENQKDIELKVIRKSKVFASPVARRIAKKYKIDLSKILGSGPGGRIIKRDVIAVIPNGREEEAVVREKEPVETPELTSISKKDLEIPFPKIRQKIADRLVQSKQTIPHFYLFRDIDMTAALAWRSAYNQTAQTKVTVNDIIMKAVASALSKFPKMNAHVANNKLILRNNINIGVAVSVDNGLLVPVIANADQKDIQEISRISRKNAEGAKKGILKVQSSGTFTISNLGMYAINGFLPIINPPECAILGVGSIEKRVVPFENNCIGIRDMITLSLVCDHRAVDGTYAAQFLNTVKNQLENFTL